MGDNITIKLLKRELHGKKTKQLRLQGFIPTVVYGPGIDPISTQAEYNIIEKVWRKAGKHTPVHVTIDGKKHIAMIKDVTRDPQKGRLEHVSFHAVNAKEPVVAEVPIHLVGIGESEAERGGLIVLQSLEKLEVRALPMDLPEALEVSILHLKEQGDHVTVGDIVVPASVELVDNKSGHGDEDDEEQPGLTDLVIASVYEPSALQAANEAAGGDADDETAVEAENGSDVAATDAKEEA